MVSRLLVRMRSLDRHPLVFFGRRLQKISPHGDPTGSNSVSRLQQSGDQQPDHRLAAPVGGFNYYGPGGSFRAFRSTAACSLEHFNGLPDDSRLVVAELDVCLGNEC